MITEENGILTYVGDTFKISMPRYTDPERLNAARNAALYLGKTDFDNVKRPLSIIRMGHVPEIFRGEFAEFIFHDVSKEVYDHIITYTTRNMRVAGGNRALKSEGYTMPSDRMRDPEKVRNNIEKSMDAYWDNLNSKETPQVSRSAMPVAAKMNTFAYQFNFLTLAQAVFKQRLWEKGAQGNTVKVIQGMYELVNHVDPELWETFYTWFGEPATEWAEVRRKLHKKPITIDEFVQKLQDMQDEGHIYGQETLMQTLIGLYGEQKTTW